MARERLEQQEEAMEEELWEGGPTQKWLDDMKATYGNVYATEFEEEIFIWRILTRFEYKDVLKLERATASYREERICEKCVLWPEGYNFETMNKGGAGVPSVLTEHIMEKSGFAASGEAKKL